jgi:hypothetical protein
MPKEIRDDFHPSESIQSTLDAGRHLHALFYLNFIVNIFSLDLLVMASKPTFPCIQVAQDGTQFLYMPNRSYQVFAGSCFLTDT